MAWTRKTIWFDSRLVGSRAQLCFDSRLIGLLYERHKSCKFWQVALCNKGLEMITKLSGLVTSVHKLLLFQQGHLQDLPGTRLKNKDFMKTTKNASFHVKITRDLQGIVWLAWQPTALVVG